MLINSNTLGINVRRESLLWVTEMFDFISSQSELEAVKVEWMQSVVSRTNGLGFESCQMFLTSLFSKKKLMATSFI